jgi:asparagine synthase (glutamine-hydrolysing)
MCGISGFVDGSLNSNEAENTISQMLESIGHRGPDGRQSWIDLPVVLGHNRLSIIDLSDEGNQPMHYFDCVIVFNGEIYNYIELREQLKEEGITFQTQSDTEVILAAYSVYGPECINKFIGMWAFAIWDKKKKELFCSRDRFGIKPFYYIHDGGKFYFGSEYKALKKTKLFSNDLNFDQVSRGLQLGWVCYHDETYFTKLKSLPAANNLIFKEGKLEIRKYWDLNNNKSFDDYSLINAKNQMLSLLENSVQIHMRSDVEISICLSGGIDSSALTGLIAKMNPKQIYNSFSIYYDGENEVDERPFINEVINKYTQIKPHFYKPLTSEILERFHNIMYQVDVPSTGSSNFSHYYLLEKIRNHGIKVVVDGQGADEYLGGYLHSMYRYNADCIQTGALGKFISNLFRTYSYQKENTRKLFETLGKTTLSLFLNEMKLYSLEYKHYYPFVSKNNGKIPFQLQVNNGFNSLNCFLYNLLFTTSLPTILHYVDRMTMAHSVESRVPLLDHRLVEFAFRLKNEYKIRDGVTKYILRESVKELLPNKIYNRRDKKGFVTPGEINWLRGPLKDLLNLDYNRLEFLDANKIKNIIASYKNGDNKNSKLVWRLATLNYWIKNFI